jgi:hypothetical protein
VPGVRAHQFAVQARTRVRNKWVAPPGTVTVSMEYRSLTYLSA